MGSEEIDTFFDFERRLYKNRGSDKPLLIRDIYYEFLEPHITPRRDDWDNKSEDRFYLDMDRQDEKKWDDWKVGRMKKQEDMSELEKAAHKSFDDCSRACLSVGEDCFQFAYQDGLCGFQRSFRLGKPLKKESKPMSSGWNVELIKKWTKERSNCETIWWPKIEQ